MRPGERWGPEARPAFPQYRKRLPQGAATGFVTSAAMNKTEFVEQFFAGVAASIIAWLIVTHGLRPKIRWSQTLTRRDYLDGRDPAVGYRTSFWNARLLRSAVDLHVYGRLRIKGLVGGGWAVLDIPTSSSTIPVVRGQLRDRSGWRGLRDVLFRGSRRNSVVQLRFDEIAPYSLRWLPKDLAARCLDRKIELEELLSLGERAEIRFIIACNDGWSGTRAVFQSRVFTEITSLRRGRPGGKSQVRWRGVLRSNPEDLPDSDGTDSESMRPVSEVRPEPIPDE